MVVGLIARILDLPSRARTIFSQVVHDLYCEFGVYRRKIRLWPTLFDVYERVRRMPGLNPQAREALIDRLGSLLTSLGRRAAYRLGWDPIDLSRYPIVFEMRGASEQEKTMDLSCCLFSIFQSEVERGIVNGPVNLWMAFEDSQRLFRKNPQSPEVSPLDELAGVIRGCGKSLCVSCQYMHGLSRDLIPNLATKVMCRLGSHHDYSALGADMSMNREQIDWAARSLRRGMHVVQLAEGAWREPFIVTLPKLNIPPVVTDAEVTESVKALDALPTIPADEFADWEMHPVITVTSKPSANSLSEAELRFVQAVVDSPGRKSSDYVELAGIGAQRARSIRRRLVELGYIREHRVAVSPRGRPAIVLEPLEPAKRVGRGDDATSTEGTP